MEEFVFQEQVRVFKWNVKLPSHDEHHVLQGRFLFLIKDRFVSIPASADVRFTNPISYTFLFNPERLSSKNNIQKLAYEAVLSTQQIHDQRNVASLADSISGYLVRNYSFGLETFSNPNAPTVLIVVDVNKTLVLKGFRGYGIGGIETEQFDGVAETIRDEDIVPRLRNLLGVPVLSLLEPIDIHEPLGLTQVPGLDLLQPCDHDDVAMAAEGICAICLEGFSLGTCRKTPCSHVFHGRCIAQWFWRKRSAPCADLN